MAGIINGRPIGVMGQGDCLIEVTRAQMLALIAASALQPECHYILTDHVQGNLLAGTQIFLHAVSTRELSESAVVNTLFDDDGWFCLYDVNVGVITELRDNLGNVVKGDAGAEVTAFDWGNPIITNCYVESSIWSQTPGSIVPMNQVRVIDKSVLDTTGMIGGNLTRVDVVNASNINAANSNARLTAVQALTGSNITLTGNVSNSDLTNVVADTGSSINAFGAVAQISIQKSRFENAALFSHAVGAGTATVGSLHMVGGSQLQHGAGSGVLSIGQTRFGSGASMFITSGNCTLSLAEFQSNVGINLAGSAVFFSAQSARFADNCQIGQLGGTIDLRRTSIETVARISTPAAFTGQVRGDGLIMKSAATINVAASAAGMIAQFTNSELSSNAVVSLSSPANLAVVSSTISNEAQLLHSGTRGLTMTRTLLSNRAQIQSTGSGALNTDTISESTITDNSIVNIAGSGGANAIQSLSMSGLNAAVNFTGTTGGVAMGRTQIQDGIVSFINVAGITTFADVHVSSAGRITFTNTTLAGIPDVRGLTVNSSGLVSIGSLNTNCRVWDTSVRSGGILNVNVNAAAVLNCEVYGQGTLTVNGGTSDRLIKSMKSTLTTGAFAHSDTYHHSVISQTLTAANAGRGRDVFNNNLI